MATVALLEVEELSLVLETPNGTVSVVDRVSFCLPEGAALGVLGESGCGKTLTALALLQLLPPGIRRTSGSVRFRGQELTTLKERQWRSYRGGRIAMVFQEPVASLNPVLTAGYQIAEVLALHKKELSKRQRKERVVELLESVGLKNAPQIAKSYPHQLSGGMCQRVMIAMALAGDPDLLIADEPTTALDVTVQAQILDLLKEICAQRGLALLWISHDLGVVAELCEEVAVMYAGRLVEKAPVQELFRDPQHPYTKGLLAAMPHLQEKTELKAIPGRVPAPANYPTGCRFRDRCEQALEVCAEEPSWVRANEHHEVSCWLHMSEESSA